MDQPERIPIDLTSVEESAVAANSDRAARVEERPDGSLVLDILVPQSCVPSTGEEIVVCAPTASEQRYPPGAGPVPEQDLMARLREALTTRIGPVEVTPALGGFQARVRF